MAGPWGMEISLLQRLLCTAVIAGALITAATSADAQSFRTLSIVSEPGASVWINGVLYGKVPASGPLTIKTISPGRKTIKVRADGFKDAQKLVAAALTGEIAVPLTQTTDEAELAFQRAERFASTDRQLAIDAYEQAIKLKPAHTDAWIGLARIYTETGQFDKAMEAIGRARRSGSGLAEATVIEARLLKNADEEEKAIALFKRAIKEGGGFQPEAYAGLGLLYKERAETAGGLGEFAKEKTSYEEAAKYLGVAVKQLSGAPDAVVLYQFLGIVYEQQRKRDQAIAVYREFLKLFPDHPEAPAFESFITQLQKQTAREQ